MHLLYAPASPFAAYTRMVARHLKADIEDVTVDAHNGDDRLRAANPLQKIPSLVDDQGIAYFDSRVIARFLNARANGKLYDAPDMAAERCEALALGISDCAVAWQYEKRMRPEEKWHQPWLDRQWDKVSGGLRAVANELPPIGADAHAGSIALAATLGYLDLRFAGQWQEDNPALVEWQKAFDAAHPDLVELKPSA